MGKLEQSKTMITKVVKTWFVSLACVLRCVEKFIFFCRSERRFGHKNHQNQEKHQEKRHNFITERIAHKSEKRWHKS